ncbi:hypothetical protein IT575_15180 [bacterium]|nr:hypothetical protein [bacterium]
MIAGRKIILELVSGGSAFWWRRGTLLLVGTLFFLADVLRMHSSFWRELSAPQGILVGTLGALYSILLLIICFWAPMLLHRNSWTGWINDYMLKLFAGLKLIGAAIFYWAWLDKDPSLDPDAWKALHPDATQAILAVWALLELRLDAKNSSSVGRATKKGSKQARLLRA